GSAQSFVVPANVCRITADVFGAAGGQQDSTAGSVAAASVGALTTAPGLGGEVKATIAVSPGQTLQVLVGGQGGDGTATVLSMALPVTASASGGAGGFNGGGNGRSGAEASSKLNVGSGAASAGGGGGGASDVRIGGATLADRVLVAGGG